MHKPIILILLLFFSMSVASATAYKEVIDDTNTNHGQNNTYTWTGSYVTQFTKIFNTIATENINGSFYFAFDHIRNSGGYGITSIARKNGINFSDNTHDTTYSMTWARDGFVVQGNISIGDSLELWVHTTSDGNFSIKNFQVNYTNWGLPLYNAYIENGIQYIYSIENQSDTSDIILPGMINPKTISNVYAEVIPSTTKSNPYAINQSDIRAVLHFDGQIENISTTKGETKHTDNKLTIYNSSGSWGTGYLALDGVNDHVTNYSTTDLLFNNSRNFSIISRIKFNAFPTAYSYFFGKGANVMLRNQNGAGLGFYTYTPSGYLVTEGLTSINTGQWYNITLLYNFTRSSILLDGIEIGNNTVVDNASTTVGDYFSIGKCKVIGDMCQWDAFSNIDIDYLYISDYTNNRFLNYTFNEGQGTTVYKSNYTKYTNGKYNYAVSLSGNEGVYFPHSTDLYVADNLSIQAWIFPISARTTYQYIIGKRVGANSNYELTIIPNDDEIRFFYTGTGYHTYVTNNANISWGTPNYISMSYAYGNSSSIKFVVNGREVSGTWTSGNGNEAPINVQSPLMIGSLFDGENDFYGWIDEVLIYNRTKTIQELVEDFYISATGFRFALRHTNNTWESTKFTASIDEGQSEVYFNPYDSPLERFVISQHYQNSFMSLYYTSDVDIQNNIKIYDYHNNSLFKLNISIIPFSPYISQYNNTNTIWKIYHSVASKTGSSIEVNDTENRITIIEYPNTQHLYINYTNLSLSLTDKIQNNFSIYDYKFVNDLILINFSTTVSQNITLFGHTMNGAQNFDILINNTYSRNITPNANNYFTFSEYLFSGVNYSYVIQLNQSRNAQFGHNNISMATEYSPEVEYQDNKTTIYFTRSYFTSNPFDGDDTLWKVIRNSTTEWGEQKEVLFPGGDHENYQIADPGVLLSKTDNKSLDIYYTCVDNYGNGTVPVYSNYICHAFSNNTGLNWTKRGIINISNLPVYIVNISTGWGTGEPSPIFLGNGTVIMLISFLDFNGNNGLYLIKGITPWDTHNFTYVSKVISGDNESIYVGEIIKYNQTYVVIYQKDWKSFAYLLSNNPFDFSESIERTFFHSDENRNSKLHFTITPTIIIEEQILYYASQDNYNGYLINPIANGEIYGSKVFLDILSPPIPEITVYVPLNMTVYSDYGNATPFAVNFSQTMNDIVWSKNGTEIRRSSSKGDWFIPLIYLKGTYNISMYAENLNGNVYMNWTWIINNTILNDTAPASVTDPQTSTGNFFVNNTWTNPADADLDHIWFRYSNGTTLQNVSSPTNYLNLIYLPHYTQNISAQTVDVAGNINLTRVWFNTTIPNNAPVLGAIGDKSVTEGNLLTFTLSIIDPDGDAVTNQTNSTYDTFVNGVYSWTPGFTDSGTYFWEFNTTDGNLSDSENITVTVYDANASTNISVCGVISAPGSYYLTQNLSSDGTCLDIHANDVSIDGQYYTINYSRVKSGYGYGVYGNDLGGPSNVTIKNLNIIQGSDMYNSYAIFTGDALGWKIENNTITTSGSAAFGIEVFLSNAIQVINNTISVQDSPGILIQQAINGVYINNKITSGTGVNASGLYCLLCTNVSVSGGSILSGGNDYYIAGNINVTDVNFSRTETREIFYWNTASRMWFSNSSTIGIRLINNISIASETINRKINYWTQSAISINDTPSTSMIVYYSLWNANPNSFYYLKNNGVLNGTFSTDGSGNSGSIGVSMSSESNISISESFSGLYIPSSPINLANTTGNHWVNHTWQAGSGNITDSYNVLVNGTWHNLSVNPFYNNSVTPHGWSNITICSYNNTGVVNLSCISQNTQVNNSQISISGINPTYTMNIGNTLNIDANYADADGDTGTFARNFTKGTFNTATGVLAWSTGVGDLGDYYWQINVSDGYGSIAPYDFVVHVVESGGTGTNYDYLTGYVTDNFGPVNGALIETSVGNTITDAFGYYSFGYLFVDTITYWINISKVSYLNNNTQVTFSSDHQWWNATLTSNPNVTATLTGHTFDSNTGSYLPGVNVNISQYNATTGLYDWYNTTSDGSAFYQLFLPSNKSCEVIASKTGYYNKNINFTLDNTSYVLDIYLINISISTGSGSTSLVVYSSEHDVRFIVLSLNGTRYSNVSVLGTLSTANGTIFYIGTTGSDGSVVFRLNGTYSYNFTFTGLGGGFVRHWIGYPFDTTYFIYVDGNITFTPGNVSSNLTNYTVSYTNRSWSIQNITSDYLQSNLGIGILGQGVITAMVGYIVAVTGFPVTNIVVLVVLAALGIVSWIWVLFVIMTMISFYVLSGKVG